MQMNLRTMLSQGTRPTFPVRHTKVEPAAERKGLSGNGRVRKILVGLSWRMLQFQPDSRLAR